MVFQNKASKTSLPQNSLLLKLQFCQSGRKSNTSEPDTDRRREAVATAFNKKNICPEKLEVFVRKKSIAVRQVLRSHSSQGSKPWPSPCRRTGNDSQITRSCLVKALRDRFLLFLQLPRVTPSFCEVQASWSAERVYLLLNTNHRAYHQGPPNANATFTPQISLFRKIRKLKNKTTAGSHRSVKKNEKSDIEHHTEMAALNTMCMTDLVVTVLPYGLVVRIPGFHPGGPGSIPGVGNAFLFGDF